MALPRLYAFTNTHLLTSGQALPNDIYFSPDTGLITPNYTRSRPEISDSIVRIDLKGEYVVAPGFLECQTNGFAGVHFTTLGKRSNVDQAESASGSAGDNDDEARLKKVARELVKTGVTGFLATVPTVEEGRWKEILPLLQPRSFPNSATLLGAHVEGPYLAPSKNGAHNPSYFQTPSTKPFTSLYGETNLASVIKLITLAPELPGSLDLIRSLRQKYPQITISLGHSAATYTEGQNALRAGARGLTHVYNAMNPLHHRDPGLVGLIANNAATSIPGQDMISPPSDQLLSSSTSVTDWLSRQITSLNPTNKSAQSSSEISHPEADEIAEEAETQEEEEQKEVFYTQIPDLIHLHPSTLSIAHRSSPTHSVLITDSIELASLPDGTYPPNDQITHHQVKKGNKATIKDTEVLIGSCITLDQGVRNLVKASKCSLAEAVRCVSENVVRYLCLDDASSTSFSSGAGAVTAFSRENLARQRLFRGRGRLDIGCRADFVILDRKGNVRQTWIGGVKVWDCEDGSVGEE